MCYLGIYKQEVHLEEGKESVEYWMNEYNVIEALGTLHHRVHRHL